MHISAILIAWLAYNAPQCAVGPDPDAYSVVLADEQVDYWGAQCGDQPSPAALTTWAEGPEYAAWVEQRRAVACDGAVERMDTAVNGAYLSHPDYGVAALSQYLAGSPCAGAYQAYQQAVAAMTAWRDGQYSVLTTGTTATECDAYTPVPPPLVTLTGVCE